MGWKCPHNKISYLMIKVFSNSTEDNIFAYECSCLVASHGKYQEFYSISRPDFGGRCKTSPRMTLDLS